jgi:hypothetical protein
MRLGRSARRITAAGIFLAAFSILASPGAGQEIRLYRADTEETLKAKAAGMILGKTVDEIRQALEAGPYGGVDVRQIDVSVSDDGAELKPGDLHVMFAFPRESVLEPLTPRLSILIGMKDGVAVSIERVKTYAK